MEKHKTHEEWLVLVKQRFDDCWTNAKMWYPGTRMRDRYCATEAEAHRVLNYAYKKWNGKKIYDDDGKRREESNAGGSIRITVVCNRDTDHDMEIIAHVIRKRIVTEWETTEQG